MDETLPNLCNLAAPAFRGLITLILVFDCYGLCFSLLRAA